MLNKKLEFHLLNVQSIFAVLKYPGYPLFNGNSKIIIY